MQLYILSLVLLTVLLFSAASQPISQSTRPNRLTRSSLDPAFTSVNHNPSAPSSPLSLSDQNDDRVNAAAASQGLPLFGLYREDGVDGDSSTTTSQLSDASIDDQDQLSQTAQSSNTTLSDDSDISQLNNDKQINDVRLTPSETTELSDSTDPDSNDHEQSSDNGSPLTESLDSFFNKTRSVATTLAKQTQQAVKDVKSLFNQTKAEQAVESVASLFNKTKAEQAVQNVESSFNIIQAQRDNDDATEGVGSVIEGVAFDDASNDSALNISQSSNTTASQSDYPLSEQFVDILNDDGAASSLMNVSSTNTTDSSTGIDDSIFVFSQDDNNSTTVNNTTVPDSVEQLIDQLEQEENAMTQLLQDQQNNQTSTQQSGVDIESTGASTNTTAPIDNNDYISNTTPSQQIESSSTIQSFESSTATDGSQQHNATALGEMMAAGLDNGAIQQNNEGAASSSSKSLLDMLSSPVYYIPIIIVAVLLLGCCIVAIRKMTEDSMIRRKGYDLQDVSMTEVGRGRFAHYEDEFERV